MTPPGKPALFLERASYRQRRLGDAARCLPLLGSVLWLIPLLWQRDTDAAQSQPQAGGLVYIFGVWVVLIVLAAVLARVLPDTDPPTGPAAR